MKRFNFLVCIFLFLSQAAMSANSNFNTVYTLQSVALLPVIDNLGGGEARMAERDVQYYLERDGRWLYRPSSQQRLALIESGLEKSADSEILKEFANSTRADGILRIQFERRPKLVTGKIHLISGKTSEVLLERNFKVEPSDLGQEGSSANLPTTKEVITVLVDEIRKLEESYLFDGEISGRTGEDLTLTGISSRISVNQILDIVTIDAVEVHPLLKIVTNYDYYPIGRIRVTEVEKNIAYGRVLDEDSNSLISPPLKVKLMESGPVTVRSKRALRLDPRQMEDLEANPPAYGRLRFSALIGKQSRNATGSAGDKKAALSGITIGGLFDSELWITENIIGEFLLGFGTESSSLDDTAGTKRSLTSREFGIFGGYRFLPLGYFYGPRFDVKLGYLSESFSTDPLSSEEYGGGSFKGLSLGGSAHVPLNREIDLEATILFAPKAGYDAKSGATAGDGANMLLFNFLGTYRINTQYSLFAGLRAATFKADVGSKGEVQYSQVMLNGGMEFAF